MSGGDQTRPMGQRVALVLAGAVARGSYEAGALQVLLPRLDHRQERPTVVLGTSSGALNAAFLASRAHLGPEEAAEELVQLWQGICLDKVVRRLWTIPFGVRNRWQDGAVDVKPLRDLLERELFAGRMIRDNIRDGHLDALAVVATASSTGWSRVFVEDDGASQLPDPDYRKGIDYVRPPNGIQVEHLLASAAVPALFPPVRIKADCHYDWYIDGGMRLNTPIKPAISLGADRIAIVATESARYGPRHASEPDERPDVDDAALQFLQGTHTDRLIEDVYRLGRTNRFVAECAGTGAKPELGTASVGERSNEKHVIGYLLVCPDAPGRLGEAASKVKLPPMSRLGMVRRFLGAQGPINKARPARSQHRELLSYAMFHPAFHCAASQLGGHDAIREFDDLSRRRKDWRTEPLD